MGVHQLTRSAGQHSADAPHRLRRRRHRRALEVAACHRDDPAFPGLLARAEGFRVDDHEGPLGTLDRAQHDPDGYPEVIIVRNGLFRRQLFAVPFERVEWILPRVRRLLLSTADPVDPCAAAGERDRDRS